MKKCFLCLLVVICSSVNFAQQDIPCPQDNPLFTIYVPDGWTSEYYDDEPVLEMYPEDESIYYTIYKFQTTDLDTAVKEAVKVLKYEFNDASLGKQKEDEINGIKFYIYSGLELNFASDYEQFVIRLFRIDESNFFMTCLLGIPEDIEYFELNIGEIDYSIEKIK